MEPEERQVAFNNATTLLLKELSLVQAKSLKSWSQMPLYTQHCLVLIDKYKDQSRDVGPLKTSKDFCMLIAKYAWYVRVLCLRMELSFKLLLTLI